MSRPKKLSITALSKQFFVGMIFFHPDAANEFQVTHQSLYRLVVEDKTFVTQFVCDTAVAVATSVLMIDGRYQLFFRFVFVWRGL